MGNVFDKTYGFISDVIHVNWLKTLYINFRMLPFIDAIRLPIIIWGRCQLALKGGKIVFAVPVKRGLLKIGYHYEIFSFKEPSQVKVHGTFTIKGEVWLGSSIKIFIEPNANLCMGELSSLGSCSSLVCSQSVVFSDYSRVASFADISDSNYHYMKNVIDNSIRPYNKPVLIGARNYVGSRVTFLPGTMTPDNITIGFGSVCNKDYRGIIPEYSIIAGIPAKLVKKNMIRIFDFKKESVIRDFFLQSGEDVYYDNI